MPYSTRIFQIHAEYIVVRPTSIFGSIREGKEQFVVSYVLYLLTLIREKEWKGTKYTTDMFGKNYYYPFPYPQYTSEC